MELYSLRFLGEPKPRENWENFTMYFDRKLKHYFVEERNMNMIPPDGR